MIARFVPVVLLLPLVLAPHAGAAPVSVSESGDAGEWLVYYQPFLAPTNGVGFAVTIHAASASDVGTPVSLFVMPPMIVYEQGANRGMLEVFETASVVTQAVGGPIARDVSLGASVGSGGMLGVVVAVAASHAWTFDMELDVSVSTGLGEPVVLRGAGALFASAGVAATPLGGKSELVMDIPSPGWTHLAGDAFHVQPVGVRAYDVSFPNGYGFSGQGTMVGANAVLIGLASSNSYWGGFGATGDTAGTLRASVTYAEATRGVNLGAVHLTGAPLPSALAGLNYRTFDSALDVGLGTVFNAVS